MSNPKHRRRRRRRLPTMAGHRVVRGHYIHNPRRRYRRNPGGGGMGIGMIALIGVGAFFLLRSGALGSIGAMFGGQPAIPGYTAMGGNAYRNNATGQVVYRQPTGQLTSQPGGGVIMPTGGGAWTAPLVQAGVMAIPQLGLGIGQMIKGFFGQSSVTDQSTAPASAVGTSGAALPSGGASGTSPDILNIPEPGGPVAPAPSGDVFSWMSQVAAAPAPAPSDVFTPEVVPQTSLDVPVAPDTTAWF